jgi:hypothetical protein
MNDLPFGTFVVKLGKIPAGTYTLPDELSAMEHRMKQVLALVAEIVEHSGPIQITITPVKADEGSR